MLNWNNLIINQSQRRQKSLNLRVWTKENFKLDTFNFSFHLNFEINLLSTNNKTDGQLGVKWNHLQRLQLSVGWPNWVIAKYLWLAEQNRWDLRGAACGCGLTLMDIWHPHTALTRGTWILASDWSRVITWPGYWPLIGWHPHTAPTRGTAATRSLDASPRHSHLKTTVGPS